MCGQWSSVGQHLREVRGVDINPHEKVLKMKVPWIKLLEKTLEKHDSD